MTLQQFDWNIFEGVIALFELEYFFKMCVCATPPTF
jgi:hypothetical protein